MSPAFYFILQHTILSIQQPQCFTVDLCIYLIEFYAVLKKYFIYTTVACILAGRWGNPRPSVDIVLESIKTISCKVQLVLYSSQQLLSIHPEEILNLLDFKVVKIHFTSVLYKADKNEPTKEGYCTTVSICPLKFPHP